MIRNDDAKDAKSVKALLGQGCAGYMVSRDEVGAPWCIAQIRHGIKIGNTQAKVPNKEQSQERYLSHLSDFLKLYSGYDNPVQGQTQGLAKYYAKRINSRNSWLVDVARWQNIIS